MFLGGFSIALNFALEQVVRAEGASKESMYGMFVSTVLSLFFDPLFILVLKFNVVGVIHLIAYNFSNGNFKRLKEGIKQSALWILGLSSVFVTLVYIFRNTINTFYPCYNHIA